MKRRSTTRKNKNSVIGGNRTKIVDGTQEMLGNGIATASLFEGSATMDVIRRHHPRRPSNTCSFSFNEAATPGKPFVNSDTRGKINAITKATIKVTPATSKRAARGRGT